jgi:hypothetical protein
MKFLKNLCIYENIIGDILPYFLPMIILILSICIHNLKYKKQKWYIIKNYYIDNIMNSLEKNLYQEQYPEMNDIGFSLSLPKQKSFFEGYYSTIRCGNYQCFYFDSEIEAWQYYSENKY